MMAVTFCYAASVPFDDDYYSQTHLPFAESVMAPLGIRRIEVRKVTGTFDGQPAPHRMLASLYFDSRAAFEAAMQLPACQQAIADIANYYGGMPEIQFSEITWER